MSTRSKLTRTEVRWANAAFGTIFPAVPSIGFDVGIRDMDVEGFLDETRARVTSLTAFGIRFAVWFVALAPLFVLGRFRTIAGLAEADRLRVVEALAASRFYFVRQMTLILKATGALLYGGHPAIRARCTGVASPASAQALVPLRRGSSRNAAA